MAKVLYCIYWVILAKVNFHKSRKIELNIHIPDHNFHVCHKILIRAQPDHYYSGLLFLQAQCSYTELVFSRCLVASQEEESHTAGHVLG